MSTANNRTKIWISIIGFLGIIIPVLIQCYLWKANNNKGNNISGHKFVVSGLIVDEVTNKSIEQAEVSIVGRNEVCYSEHNGNFRLNIRDSVSSIRIRVVKKHYHPYDKSYDVPDDNIIIQLTSE
jgi:hypothetical protein